MYLQCELSTFFKIYVYRIYCLKKEDISEKCYSKKVVLILNLPPSYSLEKEFFLER